MARDDPRAALAEIARERGESLGGLSQMLGRNAAYLQQFVRRGSPRVLPEQDRRMLADYLGVSESLLGAPPRQGTMHVPRLEITASAGPGALVDGEILLGSDAIDPALARSLGLRAGQAGIIRVRGDSMAPGINDGDHIVVDLAQRSPGERGGVFVLRVAGALMVKRVRQAIDALEVRSDNPDAPPVPAGEIAVVGRVVWQMREVR